MKMQVLNTKGFSLIELVAVIVLVSILAVAATGRIGSFSGFESRGFFDDTVAAMRYAQKLAISTGCNVQFTITAASYALAQRDDCDTGDYTRNVLNPVDRTNHYTATAPTGITISPIGTYTFSPQSPVAGTVSDITFTIAGFQFILYQQTGLVNVL